MKYHEFEDAISPERMHRYVSACANNTKRAMTLYRYNLRLSQEMYAIISCFEVSLRNKINKEMKANHGNDWLRDFVLPGGQFDADPRVEGTRKIAHHEPICFGNHGNIDTQGVMLCYARIMQLFQWMDIDANSLLYGVNHVVVVCNRVMNI